MQFLHFLTRRRKVVLVLILIPTSVILLHFTAIRLPAGREPVTPNENGDPPHHQSPLPNFETIIQEEKNLPQHNLSLPYPEGRHGRYIKFSNQIQSLGWNNVLHDVILCSYLAWRAKRGYVFQDYVWNVDHYPWSVPSWPPPRTPLSALLAGPTVGGSWEEGDDTPRSVREEWFDVLCPPEDTESLDTDIAKEPLGGKDGKYVLEHWLRLLNESPKRCINVVVRSDKDSFPQTFDLWVVSKPEILTLWPGFRDSPVSKLLRTSPLVNSAIERNEHLFFAPRTTNPYTTMMAIHLRRGDYLGACEHFPKWSSTFFGWNLLPELPDRFEPPPGGGWGTNTPENTELYMSRCYPNETQLLTKINKVKLDWEAEAAAEGQKLTTLYIMTNAAREFVDGLRDVLAGEGWERVVTSADLELNAEQTAVSMAVDMDIGRRAAVFIGNGWSSMTSTVVHRRLVDGKVPASIRFL